MINWHQIRMCCYSTRSDVAVFTVTLLSAVFLKLDTAIYIGIGVSLALFLQKTSTPLMVEYKFTETGNLAALKHPTDRSNPFVSIIHVEGDLYFGAAELFLEQVRRQAEEQNIKVFILRMKNARHLDATAAMAIENLYEYLRETGRVLLISGISDDVGRVLRNNGLLKKFGEKNVFPAEANPTISTKRALERATELLDRQKAGLRIFYEEASSTS
jgi:SulP family sulfate permease